MTSKETLQQAIRERLREMNAILLVHYYQRDEIQDIADYLGDSLALSITAATTDADVIVFAGVRFMAESAAILSPDKTVLLPCLDAGCPLADTITLPDLMAMREKYPGVPVVSYVNSSAEIKAASDICCTSSNAATVVSSIPGDGPIIMVPDKNLARYTARVTGKNVIPWEGSCPFHDNLTPEEVLALKREYPGAVFAAHPECRSTVLDLADYIGSTAGILRFARETDASQIIVGTEIGILHSLTKENPEKTFIPASETMICETMKYITLGNLRESLEARRYVVSVDEDVRHSAKKALDRMLSLS